MAWQRGVRLSGTVGAILAAIGVGFLAWNHPFIGGEWRSIGWGIPAAFIVAGMTAFEGRKWIRHPALVFGGNASYSLYLVHITAQGWLTEATARWGDPLISHPDICFPLLIAISLAAGAAMYAAVERPLLAVLGRRARRDQALVESPSVTVA